MLSTLRHRFSGACCFVPVIARPWSSHSPADAYASRHGEKRHGPLSLNTRRKAMKSVVSIFIALSVLTGVAASAYAIDPKSFYEQQERLSGGTNGGG
jgi:hypothetical protein